MLTLDQARTLEGKTMRAADGDKLGSIDATYADRADGHPTFAAVNTGLFGSKTSFVPLERAQVRGDEVVVPYDKNTVKDAPSIEQDDELSPQEEERLYSHYGLAAQSPGRAAGHDTSRPNTDDAMTRSEEHLQVGTRKTEAGRARLRKYVTSETETVDVPVEKERVTLEREPISEGNAGQAMDGPPLSEGEHEVVLTEERPVVEKEAVPVERVRLGKETVTEDATVSEDVRKEQIEVDGPKRDR